MKIKALILVLGITFLSIYSAYSQMDCRSMLGANLTPFKKDGQISWALEGTMAPGIMTSPFDSLDNTKLNGGMLLAALDFGFSKKKSHIYIEGGFKNWQNSEFVDDSKEKNSRHIGVRQVFYSFSNDKIKLKAGLHETRLGDFFLIDERMLGFSVDKPINAFTVNLRAGTVNKNFARMGKFCANRHIYGLINNGNYTEHIGEKVGETNLAGVVINWNPHYKKTETVKTDNKSNNSDEFETTDEFHENHDFNEFGSSDEFSDETESTKTKQKISLKNIGLIVYDEFGDINYIPDNKLYTGLLFDIDLPYDFFLQTGGVYQNMANQNTFVYIAKFGKSKLWNNSSLTKISGAYIGKTDIDNNAIFQPFFSNLFIGEVMRMDAAQFPLWQAAIKHKFPGKRKIHIAAKFVGQLEDAETNEQDVEIGLMAFKNHLKVTLIGSHVQTLALPNDFMMVRMEMRLAF
ncbi:MAG: hypothetical protein DRI94_11360 [Bacteroidetes bacterium]|nr:MAG: hypothetical protein DRI94_11360 [Bacteroidota bacterium]